MDFGATQSVGRNVPDATSESLAAVTPRVYILAQKVAGTAQHISASLGLTDTTPNSPEEKVPQMTLLMALQNIEKALDFTYGRLDHINSHING
jgi:hypothetical protein